SGKSDEACLRMIDDDIPNFRAGTGHKIHDTGGHAGFFEQLEELVGDGRSVGRWLEHDSVTRDNRGGSHTSHNGEWKIPRWDHSADAERNIFKMIFFAGEFHERLVA